LPHFASPKDEGRRGRRKKEKREREGKGKRGGFAWI